MPSGLATLLARHLVAAGQLLDEDPELAYAHAWVARQRAPRLAVVREAAGLAAYAAGKFAEAMPELRAARRMSGSPELLPVIADVERALGRPERALEIAASDEARKLDADGRIEMRLVAAGARRDLGQLDAAVLTLQVPEVRRSARLAYAFADALLAAGRREQAQVEFGRAATLDVNGETDADDRLAELEGVVFVDAFDEDDDGATGGAAPGVSGIAPGGTGSSTTGSATTGSATTGSASSAAATTVSGLAEPPQPASPQPASPDSDARPTAQGATEPGTGGLFSPAPELQPESPRPGAEVGSDEEADQSSRSAVSAPLFVPPAD